MTFEIKHRLSGYVIIINLIEMIIYIISTIWLLGGIYSAVFILLDLAHNRQKMKIMNSVWVLTGLWASFLSIPLYIGFGRNRANDKNEDESKVSENKKSKNIPKKVMDMKSDMKSDNMDNMPASMSASMTDADAEMSRKMEMDNPGANMSEDMSMMPGMKMTKRPMWQGVFLSALHCGAGCTLADIIGESVGYILRNHFVEWTTYWQWGFDYILALIFGLIFQYSAIRQMSNIGFGKGIIKALKVDFFSLTSWQIGMYAFMYIVVRDLYPFSIYSNVIFFSFIMQLAMLAGLILAYPTNWILIKLKVKPSM